MNRVPGISCTPGSSDGAQSAHSHAPLRTFAMPSRHQARTAADLLTATGNASAHVIAARMLAFSDPASALSKWHQAEAQRMTSEKVGAASEGALA